MCKMIFSWKIQSQRFRWSYGILLFEIVTVGGGPYADWPAAEVAITFEQCVKYFSLAVSPAKSRTAHGASGKMQ